MWVSGWMANPIATTTVSGGYATLTPPIADESITTAGETYSSQSMWAASSTRT